jgi:hypothetical protein
VVLLVSVGLMVPTITFFAFELYTMYRHRMSLKIIFVLLSIMITADTLWMLSQGLEYSAFKDKQAENQRYRTGYTIILMVCFVCISQSHWIFSFNYWSVA